MIREGVFKEFPSLGGRGKGRGSGHNKTRLKHDKRPRRSLFGRNPDFRGFLFFWRFES